MFACARYFFVSVSWACAGQLGQSSEWYPIFKRVGIHSKLGREKLGEYHIPKNESLAMLLLSLHPVASFKLSARVHEAERKLTPVFMKSKDAWLVELGDQAHGAETGAAFYDFFCSLASNSEFIDNIWAQKPMLSHSILGVANAFSLDDLRVAVDSDFLDINVGNPDGGWKFTAVAEPRGNSFEDAKVRYIDVVEAMQHGTVFLNSIASHVPSLGTINIAAMDAFGFPVCLNIYVTAKGIQKSAPPHTDKQDVFVCQSGGAKRWRVFHPPPPNLKPHEDPMARGKFHDVLDLSELGEPLLDCVLKPGDVLYVPAGFPHITDTVNTIDAGDAAGADSIHLTIGLDTHIWGLDFASIRRGALARAQLPNHLNLNTLPADLYWRFMTVPRSFGFLKRTSNDDVSHVSRFSSELIECLKLAEPSRWEKKSDSEIIGLLGIDELEAELHRHATRVFELQRDMYLDAANDVLPPMPDGVPRVTIFRAREHFDKLKAEKDQHLQWYGISEASFFGNIERELPLGNVDGSGTGNAKLSGFGAKSNGFSGGSRSSSSSTKKKDKSKRKKRKS